MKKTISLILALCMTLSFFAYAAPAADGAELQAVLKAVKSKIDIPQELDRFSYEVSDGNSGRIWYLTWRNDDNYSIRVGADGAGRILSYYKYHGEYYTTVAPKLTKAEAKERAKEQLKAIAPEIHGNVSDEITDYENRYSNSYQFTFHRVENGIPCNDYTATMFIRYDTGELAEYSLNWDFDINYPAPQDPISEEEARSIWAGELDMELMYNLVYPVGENGKAKAFLAYSPKSDLKAIDVETREIIEQSHEWIKDDRIIREELAKASLGAGDAGYSVPSGALDIALSESEITKASELNGLITVSDADKRVRALPGLVLDSGYKIARSRLFIQQDIYSQSQDEGNDKYIWDITYSGPVTKGDMSPPTASVQIDAKTGELVSYYAYIRSEYDKDTKRVFNKEQALNAAEQLANAAVPDKYANAEYNPEGDEGSVRPLADNGEQGAERYYFSFNRTYEDIALRSNYINVDVNAVVGKITSFGYYWNDNVEFESPEGVIGAEQAQKAYLSHGEAIMGYNIITSYLYDKEDAVSDSVMPSSRAVVSPTPPDVVGRKYRPVLAYNFSSASGMISAKTGKPVDNRGEEVERDNTGDGYTDIENSRYKREISLLYDVGILPAEKEFRPDDIIKQREFLNILLRALNSWYQPLDTKEKLDDLYRAAQDMKIIEKNEREPDKTLNRYEIMKYMVRALGYGKLSQDASIFNVTSFRDAGSIPRVYYGTVALAKYFSLTDGNSSNFNGADKVTRDEAAAQIYRFMNAIKDKI